MDSEGDDLTGWITLPAEEMYQQKENMQNIHLQEKNMEYEQGKTYQVNNASNR